MVYAYRDLCSGFCWLSLENKISNRVTSNHSHETDLSKAHP